MAAAETASAAGTRRAVIRSERFVQWQRELRSARRAPYGSRKRTDGDLNQQKESDHVTVSKDPSATGGDDKGHLRDVSKAAVKTQEQQEQRQSQAEKEIVGDNQKHDLLIVQEADLCNGQTNSALVQSQHVPLAEPQQEQQESVPTRLVKRRGRRDLSKDQDLKTSTRGAGGDAHDKIDPANGLASKRSTRQFTKTLQAEEPTPPPLKLPKLHVVLSRQEVQEDWFKITGRRYTGKPRKSALNLLGLGLCTSMTCPSTIRRYLNDP